MGYGEEKGWYHRASCYIFRKIAGILRASCQIIGTLRSAVVRIFTPWKSANTAHQFLPIPSHVGELVYQNTTANT